MAECGSVLCAGEQSGGCQAGRLVHHGRLQGQRRLQNWADRQHCEQDSCEKRGVSPVNSLTR